MPPPLAPEFRVNTATANDQTTLTNHRSVATNAAGDFIVIWESDATAQPFGAPLYGQRFNAAGVKQGGEIQITSPVMGGQFYADVAMDASGDFVVVWDNQSGISPGIYSQRYNAAGVAQGNNTLLSSLGNEPSVAMDADGDYVVAWQELGGPNSDWAVIAQRFDATGAGQGGPFFAHANPFDSKAQPDVAMDAGGDFVITWVWFTETFQKRLQGRWFNSQGAPQGNEFDINAITNRDVRGTVHHVAMDAGGDFTVIWDSNGGSDPDGYGVYARRYARPGAPLGGEFLVNTAVAGTQYDPSISMDAAGDFVVVWNGTGVMGQYFDAAGAKADSEFRLDTAVSPGAWMASVAMDYDGDFIAAWTSGQGGDDDVYARIYSGPQGRNVASGQVFHDVSADGAKDAGDPGLGGWTVYHDLNNNGQLDTGTYPAPSITPLTGMQPFSTRRYVGPGPGPEAGAVITDVDVIINIQHPNDSDLTATLVSPAGKRAELFSHVGATGDNFSQTRFDDSNPVPIPAGVAPFTGTYRTQNFTLGGFNSERLTDDGYWMLEVRNDGPSAGYVLSWVVIVTYAEGSALTDAAGNYSLSLPTGTSTLRQVPQAGWVQTMPAGGARTVTFGGGGQSTGGLDFGNAYPGTTSGGVFDDRNADGVNGAGEGLLGGWTIFADLNGNGLLDSNEPSTVSNAQLGYALRGVPLGRSVSLGAIPLPTAGTPFELSVAPGPVTLTSAQPGASLRNFGAFRRGSIAGLKFNDLNGDGFLGRSEPGLPGWTIYLDSNGNGRRDGGPVTVQSPDVPLVIAPTDQAPAPATSDLSITGQSGPVLDVDVTLNLSHPDLSGLVVVLIGPSGNRVQLFGELPRRSVNFTGTTFDDQAANDIRDGAAPYTGSFMPLEPLALFNGEDPDGVWTLEVSNTSRSAGSVDDWSLTITTPAELFAVTDASGRYAFAALYPGPYAVREEAQPGWSQTAPASGLYGVTLTSGQDVDGLAFGNRTGAASPRVTQVFARGSTWTGPFMTYLQAQGLGSNLYGLAVGGGAGQLLDLPWRNLNQISVEFSADVQVDSSDLAVRGINLLSYPATGFAYNPTSHTATWTFAQSMAKDKVLLDLDGDATTGVQGAAAGGQMLDGEWATGNAFPSGNGAAGGDFRFRLDVLPGNVNRIGSVLADDFSEVKAKFFRSTASPGSGTMAYTIFHDVDGSGAVVADDFSFVKSKFFSALPGPEPAGGPAGAVAAGLTRGRPPRTELFSASAILG